MISYSAHWNTVIETLTPERLKALQLKNFKRIFTWAYERSRFHRKLYGDAGIKPADIRRLQHEMARQANLTSHSYGKEPNRRVRIFRD